MPKQYGRTPSFVSRDTSDVEVGRKTNSWFDEYASKMEKDAVRSKSQDHAMFDQISSIIGKKSKYSTVQEAVLDMQKRTGLTEFLNKKKEAQEHLDKEHVDNKYLNEIPELKIFIDNYVNDRPGTSVEAVVHDIMKLKSITDHLPDVGDVPLEVKKYINDKIAESKSFNTSEDVNLNIGKLDVSKDDTGSDNDPFASCLPAKEVK